MENDEDEDEEADDDYNSRQDMKDMKKMMEFMIYKMKKMSLNLRSVKKQVRNRPVGGTRDFNSNQQTQSLAMPGGNNAANSAYSGNISHQKRIQRQQKIVIYQRLHQQETMRELDQQ